MAIVFNDDVTVKGNLQPTTFACPVGALSDAALSTPSAAQPGAGTAKLNHRQHVEYSQPNTTATSETRARWVTKGAVGALVAFRAGSIVACIGAATVTVDLLKNGTTVLSAPITLDVSKTARTVYNGSITVPASVAGDWYDIVVTATAGGGTLATGLFAEIIVDEYPS